MRKMWKSMVVLAFLVCTIPVFAQQKSWNTEFETMLYGRHLWRGSQFGDALTIEPSVTFTKEDFSLNIWAAKAINNSYSEVDLILSRTFSSFTVTIFDYYNPVVDAENRYFSLKKENNRHSGELVARYAASSKLPVNMMLGSFFYGDKNPTTGNPLFSSYAEFSYPFSVSNFELEPVLGLTTHKGYYADRFSIINSGLFCRRDFLLSRKWILPAQISAIYNPNIDELFFNFAIGIKLK